MSFDDELDLDSLESTEVIPQVAVVNATSKAAKQGGKIGSFNVQDTSINFESFTAVPLRVKTNRIWFLGNGSPYFCRSDNNIVPIESSSRNFKKQSPACQVCSKNKWRTQFNPPECQQILEVTFTSLLPVIAPRVFTMSFKSVAQKDMKLALENMSDNGGLTHNRITITTQEMKGKNFNYYIPTFSDITGLTKEERDSILCLIDKHTPKEEPVKEQVELTNRNLIEIELE